MFERESWDYCPDDKWDGILAADALRILSFASKNRNGTMNYQRLSDGTGIDKASLRRLVYFHRHHLDTKRRDGVCYLCTTAARYHFSFIVNVEGEKIIDAVQNSYEEDSDEIAHENATYLVPRPSIPCECGQSAWSFDLKMNEWYCPDCGLFAPRGV